MNTQDSQFKPVRTGRSYRGARHDGDGSLPAGIVRRLTRLGRLNYSMLLRALGRGCTAAEAARMAGSRARTAADLKRVGLFMIRKLEAWGVQFEVLRRDEIFCRFNRAQRGPRPDTPASPQNPPKTTPCGPAPDRRESGR